MAHALGLERVTRAASLALWVVACGRSTVGAPTVPADTASRPRILYFTQSAGFRHDVLPLSVQILQMIGRTSGAFDVTASADSVVVTRDSLARFDAVVFFTSGELPMSADQKAALRLLAGYAQRPGLPERVAVGESLVGQCALEKQRVLINDVPGEQ